MVSPDILSTGELHSAVTAIRFLMHLHQQHKVLDLDLYANLGKVLADVTSVLEDRSQADKRTSGALEARHP